MTVKEAQEILKKNQIPRKPKKCTEFESCFVFHLGDDEELDFLMAVDKKTGKVHAFIPPMISAEEYSNPLNVYNFN